MEAISFSFVYAKAVTPHDTNNNIVGARFLMNKGTAGKFTVRQDTTGALGVGMAEDSTVEVSCDAYRIIPVGTSWLGVKSTGLGSGVDLVAFY